MEGRNSDEIGASKHSSTSRLRSVGASKHSRETRRDLRHRHPERKIKGQTKITGREPVEYSMTELRSLNEFELGFVMCKSGISSKVMSSMVVKVEQTDVSVGQFAVDQRINMMLNLFIKSGHVKVVGKDYDDVRCRPSLPPPTLAPSSSESVDPPERSGSRDEVRSITKALAKKSKLAAELQRTNTNLETNYMSLKSTVKKLSNQLRNADNERDQLLLSLKTTSDDLVKEISQKEALHLLLQKNIDTTGDANRPLVDNKDSLSLSGHQLSNYAFLNDESASSASGIVSKKSTFSEKSSTRDIIYLKRKYMQEKEAHNETESRLQADNEVLAKKLESLHRKLDNSLQTLDDTQKSAWEDRESATNLKHELQSTSMKVKELTAEAESRDKLIATFSQILFQKVGLEGEGQDDGLNVESRKVLEEEEKLEDGLMLEQMEEPIQWSR